MQVSLGVDPLLLIGAVLALSAVFVSAFVTRRSRRFRVPGALLFLALGMLFGDDGFNLISLDDAELVQNVGVVALLFILLEGGLTTKPTDLKLAALPGMLLATLGVVLTAAVTAAGVWLLLDVDLVTAGLIGAVVGSTDAAAVFSMMRTTPLPRRTAALLRVESGSNDPIAVMLTVGLIATYAEGATAGQWVGFALLQLIGGGIAGGAVGMLAVVLLRRMPLTIEGLYPITIAAFGALAYGLAVAFGASGFIAVYLTGVLVGALLPRQRRAVLGFHEALANAAEIGLFLLLGLLVFPSQLPSVAIPALLVSSRADLHRPPGSGVGLHARAGLPVAGTHRAEHRRAQGGRPNRARNLPTYGRRDRRQSGLRRRVLRRLGLRSRPGDRTAPDHPTARPRGTAAGLGSRRRGDAT